MLHNLDRLAALGRPLLVGASRKRFLGALLADGGEPRDVAEREDATTAITALAAGQASGPSGCTTPGPARMPFGWPRPGEVGMADLIVVRGIAGFGYHGVLAHKREFGQEFTADVVIDTNFDAAAATDDLARTVDYGHVAALVRARIVGPPCALMGAWPTPLRLISPICLGWRLWQSPCTSRTRPCPWALPTSRSPVDARHLPGWYSAWARIWASGLTTCAVR